MWGADGSVGGPGLVACGGDDDWLCSVAHFVGPAGVNDAEVCVCRTAGVSGMGVTCRAQPVHQDNNTGARCNESSQGCKAGAAV